MLLGRPAARLSSRMFVACIVSLGFLAGPPVREAAGQASVAARNVLVVANAHSQASDEIATYYAHARLIPSEQILRLNVPVQEEVSRAIYEAAIEAPIRNWLTTHAAQDRILYIVLTKDVPIRVTGTVGQNGTIASVDSELSLLYRRMTGVEIPLAGPVANPYFATDVKAAKRFSHRTQDLYLVARLDGYTVADVKALIDRGLNPSKEGRIVLDGRLELARSLGNDWLTASAETLRKLPGWDERVVLDESSTVLTDQTSVLGFYSWGSNDRTAGTRHLGYKFVPGAVAGEFVSTDARTFKEPPATWKVNDRPFGGSHQSLIGDLIRDGITGVAGHVAEPFLGGTIRPDILFPAYVSGFNLVESFYLAMPSIGWQTVVIGDPLCDPFGGAEIPAADLDPPVAAISELPAFLNQRRLEFLRGKGKADALPLFLQAETRLAMRDVDGARRALEQATATDEAFADAQILLAALYENTGNPDAAADRLRRVLATDPDSVVALNNLAYLLATTKKDPAAALPFAKRAYAKDQTNPEVVDTIAWVQHLLGNKDEALRLIAEAVRRRPNNAAVRLHAAAILLAKGSVEFAQRELDTALGLNPALADGAEARDLRAKLPKPSTR